MSSPEAGDMLLSAPVTPMEEAPASRERLTTASPRQDMPALIRSQPTSRLEYILSPRECCGRKRWRGSMLRVVFVNQTLEVANFFVHWLLSLSWPSLVVASVGALLAWMLFFSMGFLWLDGAASYRDAFALSTQTFLTIGYGGVSPLVRVCACVRAIAAIRLRPRKPMAVFVLRFVGG